MVGSGGLKTDVDAATVCPGVGVVVCGVLDIVRNLASSNVKKGSEILPDLASSGFWELGFLRDQSDSCNLLCAVGLERPVGCSRDPIGCL